MIYVGTLMPYKIAFMTHDDINTWHWLDNVNDFVFLFDVIITSFSAYYNDDGILITNNKQIFINYLRGWFIIDLIASVPVNLIEDILG